VTSNKYIPACGFCISCRWKIISINNFLKILKAIFSPPAENPYPAAVEDKPALFTFEEDGFVYPFKSGRAKIKWAEIERLEGYKRDRMTVDDICMDVTWGGRNATFSEEMPGWKKLQKEISKIFPEVPANWERKIRRTPFATTYTVLYEREDRKTPATDE
jgi:hypothetical protein